MCKKSIYGMVIGLVIVGLWLGFQGRGEAAPPFKIGHINILTGPHAPYGEDTVAGIQVATEEINAKGGIQGRPIEILQRDDKGSPEIGLRGAKELVLTEKVDCLIGGGTSSSASAISGFAKENKIMYLIPISQSEHITGKNGHRYVFRITTNTHLYAYADSHAAAKLPITKWWLLNADYEYGHACYESFKVMMKNVKPDVEFVGEGWPKLGEADHTPFLMPIMASQATGLFSTLAGGDFVKIVKIGQRIGLFKKLTALGHDWGCINTYYPLGKEMPEGIWGGTQYEFWRHKDNPRSDRLYQGVAKKQKLPPGLGAASGYEAVWAIARAAAKAGSTDTEKLIDALEGIKLDTVVGPVTIRKFDHQATWPLFFGQTTLSPDYAYPILKDTIKFQDEGYPTEEDIRKARGQAK